MRKRKLMRGPKPGIEPGHGGPQPPIIVRVERELIPLS